MAKARHEEAVSNCLASFLKAKGGSISSGDIGAFHQKYGKSLKIPGNLREFCQKRPERFAVLAGDKGPWTLVSAAQLSIMEQDAAQKLAKFIAARGGSLRSSGFLEFARTHPKLAQVLYANGRTLRQFCQQHGMFQVEDNPTEPGCHIHLRSVAKAPAQQPQQPTASGNDQAMVSDLMQFLCSQGGAVSSQKIGEFYARHPGYRIAIPDLRAFCQKYPLHFFVSQEAASPHWQLTAAAASSRIAARAAIFIEALGRPMRTADLSAFYSANPSYPPVVAACGGWSRMCDKHARMLKFQSDRDGMMIVLPAHPCASLSLGAAHCAVGRVCQQYHWQSLEREAGVPLTSPVQPSGSASREEDSESSSSECGDVSHPDTIELNASEIRWAHDSIKVRFQNGMLLVDTLKELLEGKLQPRQLPTFSVWQRGSTWFAITGNRRLWVLREFAEISGMEVCLRAQQLHSGVHLLPWFRRMFTTDCDGVAVQLRGVQGCYPSMQMALASRQCIPTQRELQVAWQLHMSQGSLQMESLEHAFRSQFSAAEVVRSKPEIFTRLPSGLVVFTRPAAIRDLVLEPSLGTTSQAGANKQDRGQPAPEETEQARPGRECIEQVGEFVTVLKHSSMGCAIVSMTDAEVREAILAEGQVCNVNGVQVQVQPHKDKETDEEIPTDLFVAWGHQVEKQTPLAGRQIAKYFDAKHRKVLRAWKVGGSPPTPKAPPPPQVQTRPAEDPWAHGGDPWSQNLMTSAPKAASVGQDGAKNPLPPWKAPPLGKLPGAQAPENLSGGNDSWAATKFPGHGSVPALQTPAPAPPQPKRPPPPVPNSSEESCAESVSSREGERSDSEKSRRSSNRAEEADAPIDWAWTRFPSMGFAAAADRGRAPSAFDMELGWALHELAEVADRLQLREMCPKVPESYTTTGYLRSKPHLFRISGDEVRFADVPDPSADGDAGAAGVEGEQEAENDEPLCESALSQAGETGEDPWEPPPWSKNLVASAPEAAPEPAPPATPPPGNVDQQPQPPATPPPGNFAQQRHEQAASNSAQLQRCICDLGGLLSKLPDKIFDTMSANNYAQILHSMKAQRLVLQCDWPLQVAVSSGWLPAKVLPNVPFTQEDLTGLLEILGLKGDPVMQSIPGTIHRASLCYCGPRLDSVVLHLTRLLPGVSQPLRSHLLAPMCSMLLLGPSSSGKTTTLRDAATLLAESSQVVVVDFLSELSTWSFCRARMVVPQDSADPVASVRKVIHEQCPEVLVAEFLDSDACVACARLCFDSGVRLVASLRDSLGGLVDSFLRVGNGLPSCLSFPFATLVCLQRQLGSWRIYSPAGATACCMAMGRSPRCHLHHVANSPAAQPREVVALKSLSIPGEEVSSLAASASIVLP